MPMFDPRKPFPHPKPEPTFKQLPLKLQPESPLNDSLAGFPASEHGMPDMPLAHLIFELDKFLRSNRRAERSRERGIDLFHKTRHFPEGSKARTEAENRIMLADIWQPFFLQWIEAFAEAAKKRQSNTPDKVRMTTDTQGI